MADTPAVPAGAPGKGGKKILGMKPQTAAVVGAVVFAGAVGFFVWRSKKKSASSSGTSASTSAGAYGMDYAGQLSAIQSELESLMGQGSASAGAGSGAGGSGYGGYGGSGTPGSGTSTPAPPVSGTTGSATTGAGGGTTTTTTAPPPASTTASAAPAPAAPAKMSPPTMPTGVTVSNITATGFTVHWAPDPRTSMYRVRVTYQGALAKQVQVGPVASAAVSGLTADHTYTVHVAAGNSGGFSAETNGPTAKTAK